MMRPMARPLAAIVLAAALVPGAATAQPAAGPQLRVHVRGGAELHAVAGAEQGELAIRGELFDDTGAAIAGAPVLVSASAAGTHAPLKLGYMTSCDKSATRGGGSGVPSDEITIVTDDRGGFCVTGRAPAEKMSVKLRFRGSKVYDAAEAEVQVTAETERLQRALLRFEPPPETIDLDKETVTVTAALRVERSEIFPRTASGSAQRANLILALEHARHAHVAEATTGGDGRARFEVKTAALAGPGAGELLVRFPGTAVLSKAEDAKPIVRRADAHLALEHPIGRADPDEGLPIDVVVTTSRGPVSGGVVEVRRAAQAGGAASGESLGAGNVDAQGHAHLVATFAAAGAKKVDLVLSYVPAAPWYRPGGDLRVSAEIAGPSPLRQILLAAVVLGAAVWVASGWRRAPRPRELPGVEGATTAPSGRAGVEVVASPPDLTGWRGTVADAHDGSPIAGAELSVVAPSFSGDGVVARATSDEKGAFTIEGSYKGDARLVVSSPDHTTHEQALPPPSVLRVALVTRRRALLERLVRWARQRGAPFDGAPEPTPGHVRRAAARHDAADVEVWAGRVEQAVYGPERVDEAREREAREAEPRAIRS
jgi:hypothetical protein